MDDSTLLLIMAGAVVVSAIALVIQAGLLFAVFRMTQSTQQRVMQVMPKVEGLVDASRVAVDESRSGIREIREKSSQLLDAGQTQMAQLQTLLGDASERTRRQLDHAELVIDDTMSRIEETVTLLHKGVLKPIRGAAGVVAGVRTAIDVLLRTRRRSPDRVTVDEEMFI